MMTIEEIKERAVNFGFQLKDFDDSGSVFYYKRENDEGFDGLRISIISKYTKFNEKRLKYSFTLSTWRVINNNALNLGILQGDSLSILDGYLKKMEEGITVKKLCDLSMIAEDMKNIEKWVDEMRTLSKQIEETQLHDLYLEGKIDKDERKMLKKEIEYRYKAEFKSELMKRYEMMTAVKGLYKMFKEN